ncbi:MAG: FeoB-associated Cys-rich membrane protein [Clostridia bacterium]|nr:FeoB-associated Cys-rich membrane protein [Clostridia bacterium]
MSDFFIGLILIMIMILTIYIKYRNTKKHDCKNCRTCKNVLNKKKKRG